MAVYEGLATELARLDVTLQTLRRADAQTLMAEQGPRHAPTHPPADAPPPDVHAPNVAEPVPAPRHAPSTPNHAQEEASIPARRKPAAPERQAPARKQPDAPPRKRPDPEAKRKPGRPAKGAPKQRTEGGASLTVNGKRRGRPPGSKNRPKLDVSAPTRRGTRVQTDAAAERARMARGAEVARTRRAAAKAAGKAPPAKRRPRALKQAASTIMPDAAPDPSQLPVPSAPLARDVTL